MNGIEMCICSWNLIRFGPDDPNIYESQIRHRMYIQTEIDLFCHCASLSNKMTLFDQLIQSRSCSLKFDSIDIIHALSKIYQLKCTRLYSMFTGFYTKKVQTDKINIALGLNFLKYYRIIVALVPLNVMILFLFLSSLRLQVRLLLNSRACSC